MDSYNEQNVYKVVKSLTDNATEDDMCQLFIISPKVTFKNKTYALSLKMTFSFFETSTTH